MFLQIKLLLQNKQRAPNIISELLISNKPFDAFSLSTYINLRGSETPRMANAIRDGWLILKTIHYC